MKNIKDLGIQLKFQIILGSSFFFIGLFLFFYFPKNQESEMVSSMTEKAQAMAQIVAQSSSVGLLFDEASAVTNLIDAFKEMEDVDFAVVLKKDMSTFAVYNEDNFKVYKNLVFE